MNKISVLEYDEQNRQELMTRIEVIKSKRKQAVLHSNSLGDVVAHAKVSQGDYRTIQEVGWEGWGWKDLDRVVGTCRVVQR